MLQSLIDALGGYLIGVVATFAFVRPSKVWSDGYDTAEKFFRDWHRGFDAGYDAGWNAAFDKVKGVLISNATTEELRSTKEKSNRGGRK